MAKILIVDDDPSLREVLEVTLDNHQHKSRSASCLDEAKFILSKEIVELALVDLRLDQENGLDLLAYIQENFSYIPVIIITAYADSQSAVQSIKSGAKDYIAKPFDVEELLLQIDRLLENTRLAEENQWLKQQISGKYGPIIGESPKMQEVYELINRISPTTINVLISGESGTGKEMVARAIHNNSPRREKSMMIINCGGLPENLVESELFGYRKGAFTGANQAKKGLLEKAHQGSFLLDEVTELQPSIQVKLLRSIQDGSFIPLGGTEMIQADIRFLAATNREIENEVVQGRFREDLFYRLSGVIIKIPPLRERGDDLFLLADYFLQKFCREQNKNLRGFSNKARKKLESYSYPGNIRELENIIERAIALETGPYITPSSLIIYEQIHPEQKASPEKVLNGELNLDQYLENIDKQILTTALERTNGHKKKAAELVGLNFRQFRYRLSKYNKN